MLDDRFLGRLGRWLGGIGSVLHNCRRRRTLRRLSPEFLQKLHAHVH